MTKVKKIGILTSGGDAPGMNACVRSVVRTCLHHGLDCYFIYDGYYGIIHKQIERVTATSVSDIINRGGTKIGTARLPEFKELEVQKKAANILRELGISCLVCIGGDGTYMGAQKLTEQGINCIALPGTIDNDITSSDLTIGFDTALNTIVYDVDKIRETSTSHKRCAIVEVMGRYCADLSVYSSIACGAELCVSPLSPYTEDEICQKLKEIHDTGKRSALVIVCEHMYDVHELAKKVEKVSGYETRATVIGHTQRGGNPTAMDRVLASKLGYHAVELLIKDQGGIALGVINNKVTATPILKALEQKREDSNKVKDSLELIKILETIR